MGVYDLRLPSYNLGSAGLGACLNGRWVSSPGSWVSTSSSARFANHSGPDNQSVYELNEITFEPKEISPPDELPDSGVLILSGATQKVYDFAFETLVEHDYPLSDFKKYFNELVHLGAIPRELVIFFAASVHFFERDDHLDKLFNVCKENIQKRNTFDDADFLETVSEHLFPTIDPHASNGEVHSILFRKLESVLYNLNRNMARKEFMAFVQETEAGLDL